MRAAGALGLAALASIAALASCADMTPLEAAVCGNWVIDANEDCDGHDALAGGACARPGEANACRYVCVVQGAPQGCPLGWGCGDDGVCRQASGRFTRYGDVVPFASARRLRLGDFDGDGVPDILALGTEDALGRTPARVIYPPTGHTDAEVVPIPKEIAAPAIGELDQSGTVELAVADLGGISLLRGSRDRGLDFIALPSLLMPTGTYLRVMALDVIPGSDGDELVMMRDRGQGDTTLESPSGAVLVTLPGGEEALAGEIRWARFASAWPCPHLVFPFRGATTVQLFSPCKLGPDGAPAWNEHGTLQSLALPAGAHIDGGVLVADLDGDGHLDLLVAASARTYAAYGRGDGTFSTAPGSGTLGAAGEFAAPISVGQVLPLAVGDIDGDGALDFVVPGGIALSSRGQGALSHVNLGTAWTTALIADLNDNGLPDVVAASSAAVDLDFFNNAGGGTLNPTTIPTDGLVERLAVGDFDGDLITDLALVEALDTTDTKTDLVGVAFGQAHGAPTAPAIIGTLGDAEQLMSARLGSVEGVDGLDDVLCVARSEVSRTDAMFSFRGDGARVITAALPLGVAGQELTVALATGRFDGSAPALAAVSARLSDGSLRVYRVEPEENFTLAELRPSAPLPAEIQSAAPGGHVNFGYGVQAATADLLGSGREQLILVTPWNPGGDTSAVVVLDYDDASQVFVARPAIAFSGAAASAAGPRVFDVDGDGQPDLLVPTGRVEEPGDLLIFWNDGHGGFPPFPARVAVAGGVSDAACIPATHAGCDLLLVSPTGVTRIRMHPDHVYAAEPLADLPGGHALVSADFDGDGAADVAILRADGLQFYLATPVRP
jgi:hypothetical protein